MGGLEQLQHDMLKAGFFPEKKYSQNFLVDDDVVQKLVDSAFLSTKDTVLEIGGGTGIVTQAIADLGARVTTIELHDSLAQFLKKKFGNEKKVTIIEGDVLQTPLEKISFTKVVASPPYAISDDIMYALFSRGFDHASLVWQLEFAEKILAPPGSSEYHPLSVVGQYLYEGKMVQKISPRSFYPVPNHFSAILTLSKKKKVSPIPQFPIFVSFIRTLFRFKNKTLHNAAQQVEKNPVEGISIPKLHAAIDELDMRELKVFLMEPEEFVELFKETIQ